MAYDFRGTFNKSQFDRFAAFARAQIETAGLRLRHLVREQIRVGFLTFKYDAGGVPQSFSTSTASYIGRLVAAYEVLGGQVLYDLQVRSMSQAVYLLPGTENAPPQLMSNGEVIAAKGLADASTAVQIQRARQWIDGSLHYRREYLEHKIRRALDYADQLKSEIDLLQEITADGETEGSLEFIFAEINSLFGDFQYRVIYDDQGTDPHGKLTYSPFAPYSVADGNPDYLGTDPRDYRRDDRARRPGENA